MDQELEKLEMLLIIYFVCCDHLHLLLNWQKYSFKSMPESKDLYNTATKRKSIKMGFKGYLSCCREKK